MSDAPTDEGCSLKDTPHFHMVLTTMEGVEEFLVPLPPVLPDNPEQALEAGALCGILAVLRARGELPASAVAP